MGLTSRLTRFAFARPSVFVLTWPGVTALRFDVERVLRERGWPAAASPSDTDVLLVLTPAMPLAADAADVVDRFWAQVPEPRAKAVLMPGEAIADVLDHTQRTILDRAATPVRPTSPGPSEYPNDDMHHDDKHHDDMMMPAGRPLADEAPDRDGLTLDVLHLGLGPALPWWPAGVQLVLTLQGDVVQDASASVLAPHPETKACDPRTAALDVVRRVLFVAGADRLALRAERLRERERDGGQFRDSATGPQAPASDEVKRFVAAVRRDRLLRAMLRRVPAGGQDVWSRLGIWLDVAAGSGPSIAAGSNDLATSATWCLDRELAEVQLIATVLDWTSAQVTADA